MPLTTRLLRPLVAPAAALSLALAAGCGGDSGGDPGADPAAIVPARAPVYAEGNLKPGDDIKELAKKLSGEEDPGGAIKRELEKSAREDDPDFRFSEDVEPWLGDRIGVFATELTGDDPPLGIVAPTKDSDKARETLERELRAQDKDEPKPQVVERTHRDTKYLVDTAQDEGVAIIDDYAVFGADAAIKAAIDAREGEALAENADYDKAREAIEEDDVGFAYIRVEQLLSGLGPQGAVVSQALQGLGDTVAIGLDGDESNIIAESAALGVTAPEGSNAGAGEVLTELPDSAWAALGVSDLGGKIEQGLKQLSQLGGLSGQDPEAILKQLEDQLGINPRRDLADWIGDVGIFATGDSLDTISIGLVGQTKDADATRRSIAKIATLVERAASATSKPLKRAGVDTGVTLTGGEVDQPVHIALTDDERFIVVFNDDGLDAVLESEGKLGDSDAWKDATSRLGDGFEPAVFLDFAPIAALAKSAGASEEPDAARVIQVIEKLTTLSGGAKNEGDTQRGRVVVGVK